MDKKQTFGEAQWAQLMDGLDDKSEQFRSRVMTGDELRAGIDAWNVPYSRAAGWLGLTVDGLQKQMRGTHAVSLQTKLLFNNVDFLFRMEAITWTEEERQHPNTKEYRRALRAKELRDQRRFGYS